MYGVSSFPQICFTIQLPRKILGSLTIVAVAAPIPRVRNLLELSNTHLKSTMIIAAPCAIFGRWFCRQTNDTLPFTPVSRQKHLWTSKFGASATSCASNFPSSFRRGLLRFLSPCLLVSFLQTSSQKIPFHLSVTLYPRLPWQMADRPLRMSEILLRTHRPSKSDHHAKPFRRAELQV